MHKPPILHRECNGCGLIRRTRMTVCRCGGALERRRHPCRQCGERFVIEGGRPRRDGRCPSCVATVERGRRALKTCQACGFQQQTIFNSCFCGGRMLRRSDYPRDCRTCGGRIEVRAGNQYYCKACTPTDTLKKREQRRRDAGLSGLDMILCAACKHGKASSVAETGWECSIWQAGRCKPNSEGLMFQKKETT